MEPASILFEKLIQDGSVENDFLIEVSEYRRSFVRSMQNGIKTVEMGERYYKTLISLMNQMVEFQTRLYRQPLFLWENTCSNSFLYEKINVEDKMSDLYEQESINTANLKDKRVACSNAIEFSKKAVKTLERYHWEDTSLTKLPIMQDRYHFYKIMKHAGSVYKIMNDFSIQENNQSNKTCVERAFHFMDAASNVWEKDPTLLKSMHSMKALHLLELARALDDDKCGERVALLQDVIDMDYTPEVVQAEYKTWKQQNDQVYFQKEDTAIEITYPSLEDLFRTLPKHSE